MISIEIQEWQQMKAKLSRLEQEVTYLRKENLQLKSQLNQRQNQTNQNSQSSGSISISQDVKIKYQRPDLIDQMDHIRTDHNNMSLNGSSQLYYSMGSNFDTRSLNGQTLKVQQRDSIQEDNQIRASRKSDKSVELKKLATNKMTPHQQDQDALYLIQEICVFGPSIEMQNLQHITFKNDQRQLFEPALYYPKDSSQYEHYGNYLFPNKCRIKPTQKSHIPMQGNKVIFKSSKKPDCNIFIFQAKQNDPAIKKPHQMLQNVNPSKWLYGIVIEFNDFFFQQVIPSGEKQPQTKKTPKGLRHLIGSTVRKTLKGSLLELNLHQIIEQNMRMETVSMKDIQFQSQKVRMYRTTFCLCIFTYFPFVTYMQNIIFAIFNEVKLKRIQHFPQTGDFKNSDIFYFISQLDSITKKIKGYFSKCPVKMGRQLSLKVNQTQLQIDLSKDCLYKQLYCNWAYRVIKMMDRDTFYEIYCMIMLEESVTFVCEDKKVLTFMILLFASMLTKPFVYPYPVVSVLFSQELLQTPFTSIVGINQSQDWLRQAIAHQLIDVQNKQIVLITQKQIKIRRTQKFCVPISQNLRRVFTRFYKQTEYSSLSNIVLQNQSLLFNEGMKQTNNLILNFYAKLQIYYHENIFAYLPNNMKLQKKKEWADDQNKVIIRNQFLNKIEKQYKRSNPNYSKDPFIKEFTKTQIFSIYMMNQYQLQV